MVYKNHTHKDRLKKFSKWVSASSLLHSLKALKICETNLKKNILMSLTNLLNLLYDIIEVLFKVEDLILKIQLKTEFPMDNVLQNQLNSIVQHPAYDSIVPFGCD